MKIQMENREILLVLGVHDVNFKVIAAQKNTVKHTELFFLILLYFRIFFLLIFWCFSLVFSNEFLNFFELKIFFHRFD
jgi:hypothetical protein